MTQRLADHWHAGTRAETGTNVKGTTRKPTDQIARGLGCPQASTVVVSARLSYSKDTGPPAPART